MTNDCACALMVTLGVLLVACSDAESGPVEELQEVVNCVELCQRYEDCVDSATDVTACVEQCEDISDTQPGFSAAAEDCEDCLDGKSCQQADAAGCWADCPALATTDSGSRARGRSGVADRIVQRSDEP